MRDLIFKLLFRAQWANMLAGAKRHAEQELGSELRRKYISMQRSPLDESNWVRMFVALDGDYMALEKETSELRIRNLYLSLRVKELEAK
jgi:hypothetical protein